MSGIKVVVRKGHETWGNRFKVEGKLVIENHIELPEVDASNHNNLLDWVKPYTQPWQDDDNYVEACASAKYNMAVHVRKDVIEPLLLEIGFKLVDRMEGQNRGNKWWMAVPV